VVRLLGDHSFELANDAARPGTGTEVILLRTMTAEAFAEHAARARAALVAVTDAEEMTVVLDMLRDG
jgi:hypothetical protein